MFFRGLGNHKGNQTSNFDYRIFPSYKCPIDNNGKLIIPHYARKIRFDVGLSQTAHIAQFWMDSDEELFVICIEPNRYNLARIISGTGTWLYKLNPGLIDKRCYLLPYAAKNINAPELTTFFCTADDSGCSSVHKPIDHVVKREVHVESINLNWILRSICDKRFPIIDYIKLDCQAEDGNIIMSILESIERVAVITFEHESSQYYSNIQELEYYKRILIENGFFEANLENFEKYKLSSSLFHVDDPTYINTRHVDYVRSSNTIYTQSNSTIITKIKNIELT